MTDWRKKVEQAASEREPATPHWVGTGGAPACSDRCPHHDGKRCELMGFRTPDYCEPVIAAMAELLDEIAR